MCVIKRCKRLVGQVQTGDKKAKVTKKRGAVMATISRPNTILDVLRVPIVGRILKSRRGRLALQIPLFGLAALLIYDGLTGPQMASQNLATVGAWVHYRGLVILALLLAGNLFCMGCPFTLPRTLARRLSKRGGRFPKALQNKWLSIAGLFFIFYLYEVFDLWASPWLTAWLIVAYFFASFLLEALFTESAFCKYVCPLGAFNFVYASTSPLQIQARDANLCKTCVGKECLNGSYSERNVILIDEIKDGQPVKTHEHNRQGVLGCGTLLFVPQIKTNMDCTFCLDCARACPHDNVALAVRAPTREVMNTQMAPKHWDLGFLFIGLTFMGITNAFGMVSPVYALMGDVAKATGITSEALLLMMLFLVGNVGIPLLAGIGGAWLSMTLGGLKKTQHRLRDTFAAFAPTFIPIGLGIWAAHYGFHFVIGALTPIPIFQKLLVDLRIPLLGEPNWALGGIMTVQQFAPVQIALLIGGYIFSMIGARRVSKRLYGKRAQQGWLVWAAIFLGMMLFAAWVFQQPMEMRGLSEFDILH
jgi:ferredoxin